jgi:hypothetical protein
MQLKLFSGESILPSGASETDHPVSLLPFDWVFTRVVDQGESSKTATWPVLVSQVGELLGPPISFHISPTYVQGGSGDDSTFDLPVFTHEVGPGDYILGRPESLFKQALVDPSTTGGALNASDFGPIYGRPDQPTGGDMILSVFQKPDDGAPPVDLTADRPLDIYAGKGRAEILPGDGLSFRLPDPNPGHENGEPISFHISPTYVQGGSAGDDTTSVLSFPITTSLPAGGADGQDWIGPPVFFHITPTLVQGGSGDEDTTDVPSLPVTPDLPEGGADGQDWVGPPEFFHISPTYTQGGSGGDDVTTTPALSGAPGLPTGGGDGANWVGPPLEWGLL